MKKIIVIASIFFALCAATGCIFWPTIKANEYTAQVFLQPKNSAVETQTDNIHRVAGDTVMYAQFYAEAKEVSGLGELKGGIVPHHLLAGYIPATFFKYLEKQKPSVVVIFGPNHFNLGGAKAISSLEDWQTPYGIVRTDTAIVTKLAEQGLVRVNEDVIGKEHSISGLLPFVAKSLPGTKIVPIIFTFKPDIAKLDDILSALLPELPDDAVFVSSIDFSHFQTLAASNFHDELTAAAVKNFDYGRLNKLEIDSPSSMYMILKVMELGGSKKVAYELSDNSAKISGNPGLSEGTSYYSPYFVKSQTDEAVTDKERIASILHFGDMMLDRNVKSQIEKNGADFIFEKLAGQEKRFFLGMDAVGANLEGPFADYRRPTSKSIAFQFDPQLIATLKKYNFSLFSQANNHTLDMSLAGFNESKKNLAKNNLDYYGTQNNKESEIVLNKKIGDFNFTFIGINDTISPVDMKETANLIRDAKTKNDFVVVNVHWGQEYKEISNTRQRQMAHELVDAGADVIIGHHPHVIQEMEIYKNRPIFFSLGNFVFDQYFSVPTQRGLGIGLVFKDKSISTYVFPLQSVKSAVSQLPYDQAITFFDNWTKKSRLANYKFENFNVKINL